MLPYFKWQDLFYDPILFDAEAGDSVFNALYTNYLQECSGSSMMDLGGGTGNFSKLASDQNKKVTIIDSSPLMIDHLKKKFGTSKLFEEVICTDVLNYTTARQYDNVVAIDDFTTHFISESDLRKLLESVHSYLIPGGKFITDLRLRSDDRMIYAKSPMPKSIKTWGMVNDIKHDGKDVDVCIRYWEQYFEEENVLSTFFNYDYVNSIGLVTSSSYRVINQKLYDGSDLEAAADGLFELSKTIKLDSGQGVSSEIYVFQSTRK